MTNIEIKLKLIIFETIFIHYPFHGQRWGAKIDHLSEKKMQICYD